MAKKTLLVYPNPFVHMDHDGYPAGACPCDMPEHVGMTTRKWVGAELDKGGTFLLEKLSKEELHYRDARQQTRFKFNFAEPTLLPVTEYYKDRLAGLNILDQEILPANEETARIAGVKFVDPKAALAKAKAAATARWAAETGTDEEPEGIGVLDAAIAKLGAAPTQSPAVEGDI